MNSAFNRSAGSRDQWQLPLQSRSVVYCAAAHTSRSVPVASSLRPCRNGHRIKMPAAMAHLKVKVGADCKTAGANFADKCATLDAVALPHSEAFKLAIERLPPAAVI